MTPGVPGTSPALPAMVYANAVVTGAVVMAAEMMGSRWLAPYFGAGLYTWAGLIATVLGALALGNLWGGRIADRHPRPAPLGAALLLAGAWLAALPLGAPALLSALAAAVPDERYGAVLAALLLLFLPLVLLGLFPPYAVRLVLPLREVSGTVSGRIYGLSTLGGIAGTLGTPFVLIPLAGTRAITFGLAAVAVLAGLTLVAAGRAGRRGTASRRVGRTGAAVLLALAVFGAAPGPGGTARAATTPLSPEALLALPDGIVASEESPYHHIFVRKRAPYLLLTFRVEGQHHVQSLRNLQRPDELPAPYMRVLSAAVLYVRQPRHLLMLGLGGGMTSRYLQRHVPDLDVQVAELDPAVVRLASRYFGVQESPHFRIALGDARVYLRGHGARYDLIVADAYRGDTIPFHLLTREFFALARERLEPGGVLALNLIYGTRLFDSVLLTLREVFGTVETYAVGGQVVAFAFDGPAPDAVELKRRAERLQAAYGFPHPLPALLGRRRTVAPGSSAVVLTDDFAPVEFQRRQHGTSLAD